MKFGKILLFRTIYVIDQERFFQYKIRFGKIVNCCQSTLDEFKLDDSDDKFSWKKTIKKFFNITVKSEILIDAIPQEIKIETTQKIKLLDRSSFIYHKLKKIFGTDQWIGFKWILTSELQSFIAYHVEEIPDYLNQVADNSKFNQISWGALIAEVCRLNIFPQGEGLILAPCEGKMVREIYLKNHYPVFVRFISSVDLNWSNEIIAVKRHLHRYFHTDINQLSIGWWGSHPAVHENFISLAQTSFQQDLVKSYINHLKPVISIFPHLNSKYFSPLKILTWSKISFKFLNFFLIIFISISIYHLNETHHLNIKINKEWQNRKKLVLTMREDLNKSLPTEGSKAKNEIILKAYQFLAPLTEMPFKKIKRIVDLNESDCQIQEFFWGRGSIQISPNDYSLQFEASSLNQVSSQDLVIGLTSLSWDSLNLVKSKIQDHLLKSYVKIWKIDTSIHPKTYNSISALIHLKLGD